MKHPIRLSAAALATVGLLLVGCGSSDSGDTSSKESTTEAAASTESIMVTDAWARQSPSGTTAGAVYMTITSEQDDALVGAEVSKDVAGETQIHETVAADDSSGEMSDDMSSDTSEMSDDMSSDMEEKSSDMSDDMSSDTSEMSDDMGSDMSDDMGSMTMREVDSIELPAGKAVKLEPGGYHIMLLDLVQPLEAGDEITVTLTFESGATQEVTAEVREA